MSDIKNEVMGNNLSTETSKEITPETKADATKNSVDFEKNIKELEEIANKMENNQLSLDEMLNSFEKGINLARQCTQALDNAEKKIAILTKKPDGSVEEAKFNVE
ncbi:MAG: exodeoxyribonuclease VII small subunit [Clostridiales bacterium]|jgi:exodeoxyribonuclease VII small subunit|nr:exodeoxyribonuclease VII small subunit [Clostridiales bacterium]